MSRNVEIKARIDHVEALLPLAVAISGTGGDKGADKGAAAVVLLQDDSYFGCPNGRLKLRVFDDGSGELIHYCRADTAGPKESSYLRTPVVAPDALRATLAAAWGLVGRVRKKRWLVIAGRTRIHLDRVAGLGDFVEIEVVLADDEALQVGIDEAHALMARLGIAPQSLVAGAYLDLLAAGAD